MKCPECGSDRVERYTKHAVDCLNCGHSASATEFGAKCICEQPHHLPVWRCPVHGEVIVPMD
jgi:ribosomal protein L37AE/L43A